MRAVRDVFLERDADVVRPEDHQVAGIHPTLVLAVSNGPADQPAGAQDHRRKADQEKHQRPGDVVALGEVKSAGEQQPGGEAGLRSHALLMQHAPQLQGPVKAIMPAHDQQHHDEPCQVSQTARSRDAHARHQVPNTGTRRRVCNQIERSQQGNQDRNHIVNHHQCGGNQGPAFPARTTSAAVIPPTPAFRLEPVSSRIRFELAMTTPLFRSASRGGDRCRGA